MNPRQSRQKKDRLQTRGELKKGGIYWGEQSRMEIPNARSSLLGKKKGKPRKKSQRKILKGGGVLRLSFPREF